MTDHSPIITSPGFYTSKAWKFEVKYVDEYNAFGYGGPEDGYNVWNPMSGKSKLCEGSEFDITGPHGEKG